MGTRTIFSFLLDFALQNHTDRTLSFFVFTFWATQNYLSGLICCLCAKTSPSTSIGIYFPSSTIILWFVYPWQINHQKNRKNYLVGFLCLHLPFLGPDFTFPSLHRFLLGFFFFLPLLPCPAQAGIKPPLFQQLGFFFFILANMIPSLKAVFDTCFSLLCRSYLFTFSVVHFALFWRCS